MKLVVIGVFAWFKFDLCTWKKFTEWNICQKQAYKFVKICLTHAKKLQGMDMNWVYSNAFGEMA